MHRHVTGAAPHNGCIASGSSPAHQSTHASSKDTPPPTCAQAHPVTHTQLWRAGYRTLRVAGGRRSAPLAFRPASFARRVGSKLGQILPQHLWPTPNQHEMSHNPRPLAPLLSNLARNSPATPSNIEFASLELQRFLAISKNYRLKLCAKFVWARPAIARSRRDQALPQHLGLTPATRNVL